MDSAIPPLQFTPVQSGVVQGKLVDQVASRHDPPELSGYLEGGKVGGTGHA